jgi:hypothetical protein
MSGLAGLRLAAAGVPRWAWVALGAVLLIVAFYLALDAYGDSRYREGKANEKAAWEQAEAEFRKKAGEAEKKADKQAAAREADHLAAVADERKKIDAAVENGSSPLDVLFGN